MNTPVTTLRPGLLVSLKTALRGNVSYNKHTLESEHLTEEGAEKAKWETERTIVNPAEHARAIEVRGRAATLVRAVCAKSAFGLLCPESRAAELDVAIGEAHKLVREFNQSAELTNISVYVITGRVAADDVEAVKAINSEVRDLMADMSEGLQQLDVQKIREAANKAKQLGSMLTEDAEKRVAVAIDAAREVARRIVKAGEQAAMEVDAQAIRKITEMRTTFLDLEEVEATVADPVFYGRGLDLVQE